MKVCTDACIFGAWVNEVMKDEQISSVLDIGAGTGLLSLMMAQETGAAIDAVEMDEAAYLQTLHNFSASSWKEKLQVYYTDIRAFEPNKKYDLIICNPPFFSGDLKSPDENRSRAMHESALKLDTLLDISTSLLNEKGFLALLMPFHRLKETIQRLVYFNFHPQYFNLVKRNPGDAGFRLMFVVGKEPALTEKNEALIIRRADGKNYTEEFIQLLKPYYLYL